LRSLCEAVLTDAMYNTKFWCEHWKLTWNMQRNLEQEFVEKIRNRFVKIAFSQK
jgi:hypothetical protein